MERARIQGLSSGLMKVTRNSGITPSEQYLARLCQSTFLRLWSYPNVYRDVEKCTSREICDLLVCCGDDLIIFSDKSCEFPDTGDLNTDWRRWFKTSVAKSARQLSGAERWLRNYPDRVFVDRRCTQRFPMPLLIDEHTRVHRIVVAIGATDRCRKQFGGSGSMVLMPSLSAASSPFCLGSVASTQSPIHVFDEVTLDVILRELDTITDFTEYLQKKEKLLQSGRLKFAKGEENLLAHYLGHLNVDNEHDFVLPEASTQLEIQDGIYRSYLQSPERKAKKAADQKSYLWDHIIDSIGQDALDGTLEEPQGPITGTERSLRFMAREPRIARRMHAAAIIDLFRRAKRDTISTRVMHSPEMTGTAYVLQLHAQRDHSWEEYREHRKAYLSNYCLALAEKHRGLSPVIGIGTEPGIDNDGRSYDLVCLIIDEWSDELVQSAKQIRKEFGFLRDEHIRSSHLHVEEYPVTETARSSLWPRTSGRNDPCPCQSGLKFKKCCGRTDASMVD